MATLNDVNIKAAVNKFLRTTTVTSKAQLGTDSADEIQAVLDSISIALLLNPKAVLDIILQSKNSLQQVISIDNQIIEFLQESVNDVLNPDASLKDITAIQSAQTALLELDRQGSITSDSVAFSKYEKAINDFVNGESAYILKKKGTGTFERTGLEARQDLIQALSIFKITHDSVIKRLNFIAGSIDNFNSIALNKKVTTQILTRVRASTTALLSAIEEKSISPTAAVIEALTGLASVSSLANPPQLLSSDVDSISTPTIPTGIDARLTTINGSASTSITGPFVMGSGPWTFTSNIDGTSSSFNIPADDNLSSNRAFVIGTALSGTVTVPSNYALFLLTSASNTPITANITNGNRSISQILTDINNALGVNGKAVEQFTGSNRIVIFGAAGITSITILPTVPGTIGVGTYTAPRTSAHTLLGFKANQTSGVVGTLTSDDVATLISNRVTAQVTSVDGVLTITSPSTDPLLSSLSFADGANTKIGLPSSTIKPAITSLAITNKGSNIDASVLGIYAGASIKVGSSTLRVLSTNGNLLNFSSVPFIKNEKFIAISALVNACTSLVNLCKQYVGVLNSDFFNLQLAISPLLSKNTTLAQTNTVRSILDSIQQRYTGAGLIQSLTNINVPDTSSKSRETAKQIISSLDERGLDRASDLLTQSRFDEFFKLTKETASYSAYLLKSIETFGNQVIPSTTVEADLPDGNLEKASNPNKVLTDLNI